MMDSSSNTDGRAIIIPVPTKTYDGGCPKKRNMMGTRNASVDIISMHFHSTPFKRIV